MWECIKCGCKAIAGALGFCPQCFKSREDDVPKATTGGPSNAKAEPGEAGYIEPQDQVGQLLADAGLDAGEVAAVTAPGRAPESAAAAPSGQQAPAPGAKRARPAATGSAPAADISGQGA
jgi:hypothetical protein